MTKELHNLTEKQLDLMISLFEGKPITSDDLAGHDPQFLDELKEIVELDSLLMTVLRPTQVSAPVEDTERKGLLEQVTTSLQNMLTNVGTIMTPQPQYQWLGAKQEPIQWQFEAYKFLVGLKQAGEQFSLSGSIRSTDAESFKIRGIQIEHKTNGALSEPSTFRLQRNGKGAYFSGFIPSNWDHIILVFYGEDKHNIIHQYIIQFNANAEKTDYDG